MALGSHVTAPVREFDVRCGTHAVRGVFLYVKLAIRCACALRELGQVVVSCACAPHWVPVGGRYAF